ncbi:MAG TPA: homoserine dehydrogenase [Planctomycetaceae bacterium]|jgi:homoserine dehydrogenase|nr:homoserine dehydrogenase [Planctomycetaceae bacterium]
MTPLRVGLLGLGNVGAGVAKILLTQAERVARRAGRPIELRKVVVRDLKKARSLPLPAGLISSDFQSVVDDRQIDVAIELIGGVKPAREIFLALLESGKDVVTANKALLCEHGDVIFERARSLGRTVAFEAAVAGGIPIIACINQCLTANQILGIEAILNGTSNFILTEMFARERPYGDVLSEAQRLGYAEADPTMDVDGTDAAQKLALLARLAFGTKVGVGTFTRQGIDTLELADLKYADELGYTVKLLAVAKLVDGQLEMHVQPTLVHHDRPLAQCGGAFNMIALEGDAVGKTWYSGAGAGQMPTASAVVADLIDVATGRAALTFPRIDVWQERQPFPVQPPPQVANRYYLRFNVLDRPHVFADIADILGRNGISLASIIQHEAPEDSAAESIVPLVVMTHRTTYGRLLAADAELDRLDSLRSPRIRMPVAD